MYADVVLGLQHGDEAKGKVTHYLSKYKSYTHVLRFNGGCNAGHTIYHDGKKFVTHHIPAGVFFGVKSIIGSGCVVNVTQFFKELQELKDGGVEVEGKIFIAENAHVITEEHIQEENAETKIGTTKRGNGPAYRDKYDRSGTLAKQVPALKKYLINLYEEFHNDAAVKILCEGAQGFGLDVDWGDYPYVTSSHCTVGGALLNAIPPSWVRDVWGVAKIYETYVGAKQFEPEGSEFFARIRDVGEEYGATTGRPRQCNWLNVNELQKAIAINDVNKLVINKMDVLREIDVWALIKDGEERVFDSEKDIKLWLETNLEVDEVYFSDNKHKL
jgi:adenylosuccinate synthase